MTETTPQGAGKPVARFAPSPTGYLHIGGARTALFNWLYARHTGGRFLLRIEDTDRERNNADAVAAILDGLSWLELGWDGEPVSQFSRALRHKAVAEELLARGRAYRCYLTAGELDAMRKSAEAEKRPLTILSPWRDREPSEAPAGQPPAIRLRAPREGETVVEDRVQGRVVFQNKDLDDLIILRSDGSPTYNLAVVVDDHDMGVTHVIRGVDHLTNAGRQSQIYEAMGWPVPEFAHVPLIHGPDGAKLSKRHGALGVEAYRAMGYLPAALRNYLVRLGWSHGNDEIIAMAQLVAWFGLDAIGKSPARFDYAKLADLNGHYIRNTADGELVRRIENVLAELPAGARMRAEHEKSPDAGLAPRLEALVAALETGADGRPRFSDTQRSQLLAAMPGLKDRAKTLIEILDGALFLFATRPLELDEKAKALIDVPAKAALGALADRLGAIDEWQAAPLEAAVRAYAEACGAKLGKVAQPLRAALTGRAVSPPVFDVMAVLGRDEALGRLRDQAR